MIMTEEEPVLCSASGKKGQLAEVWDHLSQGYPHPYAGWHHFQFALWLVMLV